MEMIVIVIRLLLKRSSNWNKLKEKQKMRRLSKENLEVEKLRGKVQLSRNKLNDSIPDSIR